MTVIGTGLFTYPASISAAGIAEMLTTVHPVVNAPPQSKAKVFDLETILPLETIRDHTKTNDIVTVTDSQLELYRKAALQTAEKYTGMLFTAQRVVTEIVEQPHSYWSQERKAAYFRHTVKFPFAAPLAYLYGQASRAFETIGVAVGSNVAQIRYHPEGFGQGCCNPCSDGDGQLMIQYTAGYTCEADIPAALVLGALKYIAHSIENPGDNIRRFSDPRKTESEILSANNPALASGAIDIWRTIRDDAL